LIMPDEIINTMRRDEQILCVPGIEPIRCGRAIYFRRDDMKKLVKENRFFARESQEAEDYVAEFKSTQEAA
ncbi:MAG: type IV secretory system conjugative DNA transfer family protein, partial [Parafilimonas terrae]|nr:type IV secretory system conjugative DNA transfer family protein [Parafilimonas terrae]